MIDWYNKPLLLNEAFFRGRILNEKIGNISFENKSLIDKSFADTDSRASRKSIAVIYVRGVLSHHNSGLFSFGSGISYDTIRKEFKSALEDPDVESIIFNIDTPGGDADGNFDLTDFIYQSRGVKPILAVADSNILSGGYSIASAADRVFAPVHSGIGSVGVIYHHVDYSKANDNFGVVVTPIYKGEKKVFGHPDFPLSEEAYQDIEQSVSETYNMFVGIVARNRGISPDIVRDTEAGVYSGKAAVDIGLIDGLRSVHDVVGMLATDVNGYKTLMDKELQTMPVEKVELERVTEEPEPKDVGVKGFSGEVSNELRQKAITAERKRVVQLQQAIELSGLSRKAERLEDAVLQGLSLEELQEQLISEVRQMRTVETIDPTHSGQIKAATEKGSVDGEALKSALVKALESKGLKPNEGRM